MILRLGGKARFEVIPPGELWAGTSKLNKKERSADTCPKHNECVPVMCRECAERSDRRKYEGDPLSRYPQKHIHIRVNGDEPYENGEVDRANSCRRLHVSTAGLSRLE